MKILYPFRRRWPASVAGLALICSAGCAGTTATPRNFFSGVSDQAAGVGQVASGAWTKTKAGVSGLWGGDAEPTTDLAGNRLADDDPTRLGSPAKVSPDVFVAQGSLWETTGDFSKAMESYSRALQIDPGNAGALASIARMHAGQENYPQAADFFRKAISAGPADAALHNDLGAVQAKLGDSAGASESIKKALEIAPGTSRYANHLAHIRYDAGAPDEAYQVLMKHNNPAVAHFNMAYLHYQAGKFGEAKEQLTQVMQFEPMTESDSAIAQAVSRSRDMLAHLDGAAPKAAPKAAPDQRVAQAPQHSTATSPLASGNEPAADAAAVRPTAGEGSSIGSVVAPAGAGSSQAGGGLFAVPPGVFDSQVR